MAGREQIRNDYAFLASAVLGRGAVVELMGDATRSYTNGATIFLRNNPKESERRIEVALQASLIRAGSLERRVAISLSGRPELTRRFLALELARIIRSDRFLQLIIGCELLLPEPTPTSRDESLRLARDKSLIIVDDERFGAIRPAKLLVNFQFDAGVVRPEDIKRKPSTHQAIPELDDDEEAEEVPKALKLFSLPFQIFPLLDSLLKDIFNTRRLGGASAPGAEMPTTGIQKSRGPTANSEVARYEIPEAPNDGAEKMVGLWTYPEWDFINRVYKEDWCSVQEVPRSWLRENQKSSIEFIPDQCLEKELQRLGLVITPNKRQRTGEELDLDALISFCTQRRVDRRNGLRRDEEPFIYLALLRKARGLGVQVLLDVSGSSGEVLSGSTNTLLQEQAKAVAQIAHGFAKCGDRIAVDATHALGRECTETIVLKRFDENWSTDVRDGILSQRPSGYTRLGASLRHARAKLLTQAGTLHCLAIVFSDGFAFDYDYIGRYAREDVSRAASELLGAGMAVLWISFGQIDGELKPLLPRGVVLLEVESYQSLRCRLLSSIVTALRRARGAERGIASPSRNKSAAFR